MIYTRDGDWGLEGLWRPWTIKSSVLKETQPLVNHFLSVKTVCQPFVETFKPSDDHHIRLGSICWVKNVEDLATDQTNGAVSTNVMEKAWKKNPLTAIYYIILNWALPWAVVTRRDVVASHWRLYCLRAWWLQSFHSPSWLPTLRTSIRKYFPTILFSQVKLSIIVT